MAGMLPGVEAARRRRFHQTNLITGAASTTRPSFSLHATNYYAPSMEKNPLRQAESDDDELETVAREAKKRLDQRLSRSIRNKRRGERIFILDILCSFGNSDNNKG